MDKFETLTGIAAPLPLINIDTDMIIPKQFLKTIKRSGLGVNLFDEMRYDDAGEEIEDFVLNQPAYRETEILVAGDNFGCGSSREHAPWALLDFGIRAVIAPSFGGIFRNNCYQNGVLPVVLPEETVEAFAEIARTQPDAPFSVDLERQVVVPPNGAPVPFEIDGLRKQALLKGVDDLGLTASRLPEIAEWQAGDRATRPWVWLD